ncbi:ubiquinol:cytochrome c oxidoreductase 50 kDa core 1 subunit [Haematococcus lacustris]
MQALSALLRQGSKQQASAFAARAFGSIVPAQDSNPFLRFSSPFPKPFDHSPLLATLPETQVTTLPNGLRVATEHIPFAETTTLGVWINSGSRFETDETNGVAHFLEHILFKGTNKRTVKELEVEVENMGGQLNAYTGREQTAYYAKVLGKDVGKAVGILSDILLNSNLDERAINKERDVILREMEEVNKQTSELVFDHLHATAFQFSPLGRTILGPVENIKSINRDQLVSYMKTHYRGPRMVLAAAGAVNHAELVKLATDAFGGIPDEDVSTSVRTLVAKDPSKFTGSYVHDRFPDATECALAVAFKGASWTDPDSIPLMVIQTMLGGWDKSSTTGKHASSKMTQTVAIENLADAYMAFNTNYHDTGLFGVYGVTDRDRCEDFAWTIMNEMTRTCYEVSEAELGRAKNQLKSSLMFFQDSTHHVAESIGRELLVYGRRLPKAELFARIDAVDAATIKAVADRFIYDQDMAIASVGDVQFMPDYNFFRRRSYWLRY